MLSRYSSASSAGQIGMPPIDMQVADSANATLVIHARQRHQAVQELGEDESYRLDISYSGAKLDAPTTLGVMRGLQTFLQLVETTSAGFAVPAVSIEDSPRFPWRGLMIDVGRHFIPLDVLKRNLDGMAAVKLNVFHWHLSENQGFRIESKKFPKLQDMGSDGLYYTQDRSPRANRVCPRARHSRRSGIRYAGACDRVVCGLSRTGQRARDRIRSSAGGAFSIPPWIPPGRKPTSFWTHSSARWPDFFPISSFISEATK